MVKLADRYLCQGQKVHAVSDLDPNYLIQTYNISIIIKGQIQHLHKGIKIVLSSDLKITKNICLWHTMLLQSSRSHKKTQGHLVVDVHVVWHEYAYQIWTLHFVD